jgi:hypothetical protein
MTSITTLSGYHQYHTESPWLSLGPLIPVNIIL